MRRICHVASLRYMHISACDVSIANDQRVSDMQCIYMHTTSSLIITSNMSSNMYVASWLIIYVHNIYYYFVR